MQAKRIIINSPSALEMDGIRNDPCKSSTHYGIEITHHKRENSMKIISKILMLLIAVAALTACIDKDEGKMQGNKAASEVTK